MADISSGKLSQPTVVYSFADYGSVFARLSPDESLVYISGTGVAGATFFDKTTGAVSTNYCATVLKNPLEGRTQEWWFQEGQAFADNLGGTGSTVYYAENTTAPGTAGNDQYVGFVNVTSNGASCTMTESPKSNVEMEPNSADVGTLATWPPRAF